MLSTILNLTSEPNIGHLSLIYQTLGFTFTNISLTYAVCGSVIVLCMFATTLRNLIYKVLNLAVLSVFVVALWAYLTDVTFIYVVYILTFVSAVVMLFLSVVLMLPSSAIAVTRRNGLPALLLATSASENMAACTSGAQWVYFSLMLTALLLLVCALNSFSKKTAMMYIGIMRQDPPIRPLKSDCVQPLKCGIFLPDFITRAIKRVVALLVNKFFIFALDFYNAIVDFENLYKLPRELLKELSKQPVFKGRYTFFYLVRDFPATGTRVVTAFQLHVSRLGNFIACRVSALSGSAYAECAVQFFATLSIFFLAVPWGIPGHSSNFTRNLYFTEMQFPNQLENLAAIQYGLYIGQPMLIIVSVTGLLVALIGAAFFVSRGN